MSFRVFLGSLLTGCILLATCGQAEAFGRRSATCYMPTTCCYPIYSECPPYYPPWPHYIGWDCVCNHTNLDLRVYIASVHGSFEIYRLRPGECVAFWFYKDGKPRTLSAFALDGTLAGTLIDLTQFSTLDQTGRPYPLCLPIVRNAPVPVKGQERQRVKGNEGTHLAPTGQPF